MRVVLHRLWTCTAAFYEAFSAKVVRELARRTEFVYTPEHGSLLNMPEIKRRVLVGRCLRRMLPDMGTLSGEGGAWIRGKTGRRRARIGASERRTRPFGPMASTCQRKGDGRLTPTGPLSIE